jgi:hypothetical protein
MRTRSRSKKSEILPWSGGWGSEKEDMEMLEEWLLKSAGPPSRQLELLLRNNPCDRRWIMRAFCRLVADDLPVVDLVELARRLLDPPRRLKALLGGNLAAEGLAELARRLPEPYRSQAVARALQGT